MKKYFAQLDTVFIRGMQKYSIPLLRVSLGVVFLWFGLLKILGESPVENFISDVERVPSTSMVLGRAEELI